MASGGVLTDLAGAALVVFDLLARAPVFEARFIECSSCSSPVRWLGAPARGRGPARQLVCRSPRESQRLVARVEKRPGVGGAPLRQQTLAERELGFGRPLIPL